MNAYERGYRDGLRDAQSRALRTRASDEADVQEATAWINAGIAISDEIETLIDQRTREREGE